jgi:Protein of unknown function (DUF2840)
VRADLNAGRALERDAGAMPSRVELTWLGGRIEYWILSGYETGETILDRCRRVLSHCAEQRLRLHALGSNHFGIIVSRIDIVRPIDHGAAYQTLPFVRTSCCASAAARRPSARSRPPTPSK